VTYVVDSLAKGLTRTLTDLHVDPRLAQVPTVLSAVVFGIAGRIQGGLVSALDGTAVLGRFTPIQAINFIIEPVKQIIEALVTAGKNLINPSALAATAATPQEVASPTVAATTHEVTLSTAQAANTPKSLRKNKESSAAADIDVSAAPSTPVTDTEKSDASKADTAEADAPATDAPTVKKPTAKRPTLKLPTLRLPKLKFPASKKSTPAGKQSESESKDAASEGSSK
jgi:hypothetical protein